MKKLIAILTILILGCSPSRIETNTLTPEQREQMANEIDSLINLFEHE